MSLFSIHEYLIAIKEYFYTSETFNKITTTFLTTKDENHFQVVLRTKCWKKAALNHFENLRQVFKMLPTEVFFHWYLGTNLKPKLHSKEHPHEINFNNVSFIICHEALLGAKYC